MCGGPDLKDGMFKAWKIVGEVMNEYSFVCGFELC
jgi:hypothetical protein